MMRRHGKAELGNGIAAVGQQALAEGRIGPCLGDDARTVLRHPLLFGQVLEFVDEFAGLHAALFERRLDGVDALLDGSRAPTDVGLIGHFRYSQK